MDDSMSMKTCGLSTQTNNPGKFLNFRELLLHVTRKPEEEFCASIFYSANTESSSWKALVKNAGQQR
jgi:hypothetical protein